MRRIHHDQCGKTLLIYDWMGWAHPYRPDEEDASHAAVFNALATEWLIFLQRL